MNFLYDACHMTKMAARPIHGKNPKKIFFTGTGRSIPTELGMLHLGLLSIIVCANDDPGVTLTYFTTGSDNFGFSIGKWENSGYFRN